MSRTLNQLNFARIKNAKVGKHADGGNLYLQVKKGTGSQLNKSWLFRFELDGRERSMGLGSVNVVSLADAREKAAECRRLVANGLDPLAERDKRQEQQRLDDAKAMTFDQCAELYMAAHKAGWRNAKHIQQWKNTLSTYPSRVFGSLPVAAVDMDLVLKVLEPIWTTKPETAGRMRGRIERILDFAKTRGYRQGENPARWKGCLDTHLAARGKVRKVKHHAALPYAELPEFMIELRERTAVSAIALEFLIFTVAELARLSVRNGMSLI
jgi:hypothetical protein